MIQTFYDLNSEEYIKELLEMHDREVTSFKLKELFYGQPEANEMEISSDDKHVEKIQITTT